VAKNISSTKSAHRVIIIIAGWQRSGPWFITPAQRQNIQGGESLFLRKLFLASLPNKRQKSRDR
jgi:hypothetical protein